MPIFIDNCHYRHALETVFYYRHKTLPMRYSYFARLPQSAKSDVLLKLNQNKEFCVEIIAYCLMPNHIHLLLKQMIENGVSDFMRKFSSSYTHYFNIKNKRIGPLFQGRFKSIHIDTDEQLLHVSRYIHLNPYSSGIVKSINDLQQYSNSSLPEYLGLTEESICQKDIILNYFKKTGSYQEFVFDQAEYQRELELIKHLTLESVLINTPGRFS